MTKFALPSKNLYPLDTISDVVKAERYFLTHEKEIPIELRKEYCEKVATEQKSYKLKTHEKIASYASEEIDPIKANITVLARKAFIKQLPSEIDTSNLEKIASMGNLNEAIMILMEFDRSLGLDSMWDNRMLNPIVSLTKISEDSPPGLVELNGERATEDQIQRLAQNWTRLNDIFGKDFIQSFKKEPLRALNKLSEDEKVVIIRMARDMDATNGYYI